MLHLDFETRSRCDLIKHGAYNYAQDVSTQISCLAYAYEDEDVKIWRPLSHPKEKFPKELREMIADGVTLCAHNATFERLIIWYVMCNEQNIPEPPIEQFYCTMAQCLVNGYPAGLENACKALNTDHKKDMRGHQLMKKLCKPNRAGNFYEDFDDLVRQDDYCMDDVRTERDVHHSLRTLTDSELADYHVSEHINDRGVLIDHEFANLAQQYANTELEEINNLLLDVTDGEVERPKQHQRIKKFLLPRMSEEAKAICKYYDNGEVKYTTDKNARFNLLQAYADDPDFLSDEVADVIELVNDAGNSSVSKYKKMAETADFESHRVCGAYRFNGASGTGRYSSMGLQLHNLRRDCYKGDEAIEVRSDMIYGLDVAHLKGTNVMEVLAKMLRPTFIAPKGKQFVCGDWSGVEARTLPWLANTPEAEPMLNIFREGKDVYIVEAGKIYRIDAITIAKDSTERQIGKVAVLSLGYAGSVGAFKSMAKNYQVVVDDIEAQRIVDSWREANQWAVVFWNNLRRAAVDSVRYPGKIFTAGRISYITTHVQDSQTLWCLLPSGRLISYPRVMVKYKENKWGNMDWELSAMKGNWLPKKDATEWPRFSLWRGLLAENVTQAVCADVLRDCMHAVHADGQFDMVLHTHDEIVLEVPDNKTEDAMEYLQTEMETIPDWAEGLPLDAELWTGPRYRK